VRRETPNLESKPKAPEPKERQQPRGLEDVSGGFGLEPGEEEEGVEAERDEAEEGREDGLLGFTTGDDDVLVPTHERTRIGSVTRSG
jgi:hypothetical protein